MLWYADDIACPVRDMFYRLMYLSEFEGSANRIMAKVSGSASDFLKLFQAAF